MRVGRQSRSNTNQYLKSVIPNMVTERNREGVESTPSGPASNHFVQFKGPRRLAQRTISTPIKLPLPVPYDS